MVKTPKRASNNMGVLIAIRTTKGGVANTLRIPKSKLESGKKMTGYCGAPHCIPAQSTAEGEGEEVEAGEVE